jgi:hypothetical protein
MEPWLREHVLSYAWNHEGFNDARYAYTDAITASENASSRNSAQRLAELQQARSELERMAEFAVRAHSQWMFNNGWPRREGHRAPEALSEADIRTVAQTMIAEVGHQFKTEMRTVALSSIGDAVPAVFPEGGITPSRGPAVVAAAPVPGRRNRHL